MTRVRSTYIAGRQLPPNRRLSIKLKILGTQGKLEITHRISSLSIKVNVYSNLLKSKCKIIESLTSWQCTTIRNS